MTVPANYGTGLSNHRNGATKHRNGYNKYRNGAYHYRNWHDKYRNGAFNYLNGAITYQNGVIYLYKDKYLKMKIPDDTMNKAWVVVKYGCEITRPQTYPPPNEPAPR